MRKTLERNERTGQFAGKLPVEIGNVADQMATEYFKKFNEVDIFDLMYIFESRLRLRGILTRMEEGNEFDKGPGN